ncbi:MAG: hypothetical protein HQL52_01920 [Magnetococcales bacterium]|nr:hypothetical protein [Magnetococcales bacterium]
MSGDNDVTDATAAGEGPQAELIQARRRIAELEARLAAAGGERERQLIAELESSNQELKEFAYVVSHDLKAPLRAINSLVQWLSEDYEDVLDEDGQEQMGLIISRVKRMESLINGVLQYSRIGRMREAIVPVNLHKLLVEVIDSLSPPGHIQITIPDEMPAITGEKTRLGQIFQNLLSNGIKYMDKEAGLVEVAWEAEGESHYRFSVTDNGPGIPKKDHERIFQIFQTLQGGDEYESTGVGLTLVKKIVALHGGRVWLESAPGEGSTFYFTLAREAS